MVVLGGGRFLMSEVPLQACIAIERKGRAGDPAEWTNAVQVAQLAEAWSFQTQD